ncbi:hypothetical protein [Streptomyces lydicus]|uniref:hypothetical protein n=1 Tax=Streptomyces lydicus TaxID=47763 RepID=UPI0036FBB6BF
MVGTKWSAAPWGMALALVTVTAAAAPAAAHGQASDRARPAQRIVLTNADTGRSVTARLGDDVEVRLTGYREHGLTYTWSTPASSNSTVLRRTAGGTSPSGDASAVFHAEHRGTATITAVRRCRPAPGHLCPLVVVPWKATVEVQ